MAIVGLSRSTHDLAPWDNPEWEKWGLPWDEGYWARMDRLFEMHDLRLLTGPHSRRKPDYIQRLAECGVPLYMQSDYALVPGAIRYPFEDVAKTTGAYWNSSIAYAVALAIHEGAEEIALYGVDMQGEDEYGYQRPNMEYLLGLARGRGIRVHLPEQSPLLKFQASGIRFYAHDPVYVGRYGWLGDDN